MDIAPPPDIAAEVVSTFLASLSPEVAAAIAEVEAAHASEDIVGFPTDCDGPLLLRIPTTAEIDARYKALRDADAQPDSVKDYASSEAERVFVLACTLYPERKAMETILARRLLLAESVVAPKLLDMALGATDDKDADLSSPPPWLPPEALAAMSQVPSVEYHGVNTSVGPVLLKTPISAPLKRYQRSAESRRVAAETFVGSCLAWPSFDELQKKFAARPLLGPLLAGKLLNYATGVSRDRSVKLRS